MASMTRRENGNTVSESRYRNWLFTYFFRGEDDRDELANWCVGHGTVAVCQEEACPETGKLHLQGYVSFKSGMRLSTLRKRWGTVHWEIARNKDACEAYCQKKGPPRVGGSFMVFYHH